MPPARAATEGIAGDSRPSASTREYVSPSVVLPNRETIAYAIRLPKPDLMNPPARKNAMAMSQLQSNTLSQHTGKALTLDTELPCGLRNEPTTCTADSPLQGLFTQASDPLAISWATDSPCHCLNLGDWIRTDSGCCCGKSRLRVQQLRRVERSTRGMITNASTKGIVRDLRREGAESLSEGESLGHHRSA